jgi:hypothetical protein
MGIDAEGPGKNTAYIAINHFHGAANSHSASQEIPSLSRWPFQNFVDLPYYSESEVRGDAVTVSFSKYHPWQVMNLQRSTHLSKMCCRPLITSKFLASELPFHGWKSPEIAWNEI